MLGVRVIGFAAKLACWWALGWSLDDVYIPVPSEKYFSS
jgi:hypothetical protein